MELVFLNRLEHFHIDYVCLLVLREVLLLDFLGQLLLLPATEILLKPIIVEIDAELGADVQVSLERALVRSKVNRVERLAFLEGLA